MKIGVRRMADGRATPPAAAKRRPLLLLGAGVIAGLVAPAGLRALSRGLRSPVDTLTNRPSGRGARAPTQIPARGWRRIAMRTFKEFNDDNIPSVAAGATFYSLLALFPALGAFVSLYGLIANAGDAQRQIVALAGLLPGGAVSVLSGQVTRLAAVPHARLGLAFAFGLLVSLWSSNAGVKGLISGLNTAYEQKERRNFLTLNAVSLAFTLGGIALSIAATAAVVAAPETLSRLGLKTLAGMSLLRWPVLLVVVTGMFSLLYRYGPCRTLARWRWITPGGLVAALAWMLMSAMFSWYVADFGHYDRTYGSLGAMIGFMTWIWLSLMVVLLGAELNAEIEAQAAARS